MAEDMKNRGIISEEEYVTIEQKMCEKFSIKSTSIYRNMTWYISVLEVICDYQKGGIYASNSRCYTQTGNRTEKHIGFPTTTKITFLASPQQRTPWPVFQDGRCNTSPTSPYYNVTIDSFGRIHSFRATSGHHYLVSGTFHPPIGVLFSFPSRYFYSIGLETYLELGGKVLNIYLS